MRPYYSHTGAPSVDPVVVFKMDLIGYLYNIPSERKPAEEVRLNMAFLWFLGYDIDESPPDHSILSKASCSSVNRARARRIWPSPWGWRRAGQGYKTRFYTAANLADQLVEAKANHALSRIEKLWRKLDLVVLDELGYVPFLPEAAQLLFAMISARYELGSFIVTSNLDFSRWTEIFGDEGMTRP